MEPTRRKWLAGAGGLLAAGALSLVLPASGRGRQVVALGGQAFGSYWRATVPSGTDEAGVRGLVDSTVKVVDRSMSPFRPDSEISRFNAIDSTISTPVSGPFQAVVAESLRIAALSGGAFDPTVGPLVNRYGFGPIRGKAGGSLSDIKIGDGTIRKARPEATLDLCGIAKGYALDRIATALTMLGINDFVVELGGEVFARGLHPEGRPWRIAIEVPTLGVSAAQRIIHLDGQALATSGDAINSFTFAGKRYSHIIDQRRAAPVDGDVASVSVIARDAMQADALATALMVMGPRIGSAFAAKHNISTLMLLRDGDRIREVVVAGFRKFLTV